LRRVAADLYFVDAVVAENGAVIEFPDSGYSAVLGQPPSPSLLAELRQLGIPYAVGRPSARRISAKLHGFLPSSNG